MTRPAAPAFTPDPMLLDAIRESVGAGLHGPAEIRRGPEGFQFWSGGRMWFDGCGSSELRHLMPLLNRSDEILKAMESHADLLAACEAAEPLILERLNWPTIWRTRQSGRRF